MKIKYVETTSVQANLCTCNKAHQYEIAGDPQLFEKRGDDNVLILPLRLEGDKRLTVFDSILVFCECGHLTIHYPITTPKNPAWESRPMWKKWRHFCDLEWQREIPNTKRTLLNILRISLSPCALGWQMSRHLFFVNIPDDNHNIHEKQRSVAYNVISALLTCGTHRSLIRTIDHHTVKCNHQASLLMIDFSKQLNMPITLLTAVIQELYNLRHSNRSKRLEAIRFALQKLCSQAGIKVPELATEDSDQPEIIKKLAK